VCLYCDFPDCGGGGGGGSGPAAMAAEIHYNIAAEDTSSDGGIVDDTQTQVYEKEYLHGVGPQGHAGALEEPTDVGQDACDVAVDIDSSNPTPEPSTPTPTAIETAIAVETSMALPPPGLHAVPEPLTFLTPPGLQTVPEPSSPTPTAIETAIAVETWMALPPPGLHAVPEPLTALPPQGLQTAPEEAGGIDIDAFEANIAAAIDGAGPKVGDVDEAGDTDSALHSSMAESYSRLAGQQADALTPATWFGGPMELNLVGEEVVVAAPLPAQSSVGTLLDVQAPQFALVAEPAIEEV